VNRTEFLRQLPYFAGLDEDEVVEICARAPERKLEPGEVLLEEGSESDAMYVVFEGDFEIVRTEGGTEVPVARAVAGDVLGEISLLAGTPRNATARAIGPARVIELDSGTFADLTAHPTVVRAMLRTVVTRLRETESIVQEAQRLASLGTLAAGIIHELNNPAAAVQRATGRLNEALVQSWEVERNLAEAGTVVPVPTRGGDPPTNRLARADLEDELSTWLRELGIGAPHELAAVLASAGWRPDALAAALGSSGDGASRVSGDLVRAFALRLDLLDVISEAKLGARRLSEIVGSTKRYAHVGEGAVTDVDVHESLRDTLVVLRHKLRDIDVEEELADDLPAIEAFGTELNQVWTNLIDNAVDAVDGQGRLVLRTRRDGDAVVVEVTDDGPGIPEDVQRRIFDPFFTTKEPGRGTGLGLDTVQRIVARHGGGIEIDSRPGETTFRVRLPRRLPENRSDAASAS
jgi:signal transduction histidine kinase